MIRALAASLFTPPLLLAFGVLAGIDLLDRDPCEGWERKSGCSERETAGDRWSRDRVTLDADDPRNVTAIDAKRILDQVDLPKPGLAMLEVDIYGNILLPVQADALVTHDGEGDPGFAGENLASSCCARSVAQVLERTDGPFTVVCLPREFGLYERVSGQPSDPANTILLGD